MAFLTNSGATYPLNLPRQIVTTIAGNSLTTPVSFPMAKGYVTLTVTDSTSGYTFSFSGVGGYNNPSTLPTVQSALFVYPASAVNCTVSFPTDGTGYVTGMSTKCIITTPSGDTGGRMYQFIFYVYPGVLPTISQLTGAAPSSNLVITSTDYVYSRFNNYQPS